MELRVKAWGLLNFGTPRAVIKSNFVSGTSMGVPLATGLLSALDKV